jgi:hypothetical protein
LSHKPKQALKNQHALGECWLVNNDSSEAKAFIEQERIPKILW